MGRMGEGKDHDSSTSAAEFQSRHWMQRGLVSGAYIRAAVRKVWHIDRGRHARGHLAQRRQPLQRSESEAVVRKFRDASFGTVRLTMPTGFTCKEGWQLHGVFGSIVSAASWCGDEENTGGPRRSALPPSLVGFDAVLAHRS